MMKTQVPFIKKEESIPPSDKNPYICSNFYQSIPNHMIRHYLSVAWQQLTKYRLQSFVSIVSLAIGFACFALASMWIKYETTYDAFHKDADRLYTILLDGGIGIDNEAIKTTYLDQIPEVSEYTLFRMRAIKPVNQKYFLDEHELQDEHFLSILNVEFIEGGPGFMHDEGQVAVSEKFARRFWGDESPIGKDLIDESYDGKEQRTRIVTGVFKDWEGHSNFPMDLLSKFPEKDMEMWGNRGTCVTRLHPSADADSVYKKLYDMMIKGDNPYYELNWHLQFLPITEMRHHTKFYNETAKFQMNHIYLFSVASLLLIVCGLLNYLTMFINRLFIRKREIALRKTFGASGWNLITQFLIEYGLLLFIALAVGFLVVELSMDWFYEMSRLPVSTEFIYQEVALYSTIVLVFSLLLSMPVISYFQRQSLQSGIVGAGGLMRYHIFRRISTGVQIGISIFCIFCVVVMMKQIDTLQHGDIGFKRENRGYVGINEDKCMELLSFINQQPEVDTTLSLDLPIFPSRSFYSYDKKLTKENNPQINEPCGVHVQEINEPIAEFYELTLLQGRWPRPGDFRTGSFTMEEYREMSKSNNVCINQTLARHLGWEDPIGKTFVTTLRGDDKTTYTIVGVYKDIQSVSPTEKAVPSIGAYSYGSSNYKRILIKFKPDSWSTLRQKIIDFYKKNEWGNVEPRTFDEKYSPMLMSEKNLRHLLSVTTGVCILIALFGVWSMIMLTCEQRRKEIAVRKVFGATTKDILDMFIVEYMALQGVAALVAFPIGYACMKPWLEQYVVQTEIPWWIYVGIFLMVALLVALCVGWRVWKTATAHPADEICKG